MINISLGFFWNGGVGSKLKFLFSCFDLDFRENIIFDNSLVGDDDGERGVPYPIFLLKSFS